MPAALVVAPDTAGTASAASPASMKGLDAINFLMADVRDGLGPFLAIFLVGQGWSSGAIGMVIGIGAIAGALSQLPVGLLVDAWRGKRAMLVLSGLAIAASSLLIVIYPTLPVVAGSQVILGIGGAVIAPCIAALSLGLVGHQRMPARVSRNEAFNHAGNFTAALLAGVLGQYIGFIWVIYLLGAFAVASAFAVLLVRPDEIDHQLARGGEAIRDGAPTGKPLCLRDFCKRRDVLLFLLVVMLFHVANAAMLPLAGQMLARFHPGQDVVTLSACVISAQLVMIPVAIMTGHAMTAGVSRKTLFLLALAILPLRGLLFSLSTSAWAVVAIQLLDGVAAGIFGVIAVVIVADLLRGTGRFNLGQGLVTLAVGAGAAMSNVLAGRIVDVGGFGSAFLALTAIAVVAFLLFLRFPEENVELGWKKAGEAFKS